MASFVRMKHAQKLNQADLANTLFMAVKVCSANGIFCADNLVPVHPVHNFELFGMFEKQKINSNRNRQNYQSFALLLKYCSEYFVLNIVGNQILLI